MDQTFASGELKELVAKLAGDTVEPEELRRLSELYAAAPDEVAYELRGEILNAFQPGIFSEDASSDVPAAVSIRGSLSPGIRVRNSLSPNVRGGFHKP